MTLHTGSGRSPHPLLTAVLLALIVSACAASAPGSKLRTTPQDAAARPVPAPLTLPAPDNLAGKPRATSLIDRSLDGSEIDGALPQARVFPAAPKCSFAPGGTDFGGAAFAIYRFPLSGYNGAASITTSWTAAPATGSLFFGLGDSGAGRWVWFNGGTGGPLDFGDGIDFLNESDEALVAVVVLGTQIRELATLEFGENAAPTAVIRAQYLFVDEDVPVHFDASASTDDGNITGYEWDLDGDGSFETDTGTDPGADKTFPLAGTRTVGLRVSDDLGLTGETSVVIKVDTNGYDEVEPNNATGEENELPGMAFAGWEGNLGAGGYDGSVDDFYKLTVTEAVLIHIRLNPLSVNDDFGMTLFDSTGANIITSQSNPGIVDLYQLFSEPGTYLLDCSGGVPPSGIDYYLSSEVIYDTAYDEVEPNNSGAAANDLDANGSTDYYANLGAAGYDGGSEDWFKLQVPVDNLNYRFRRSSFSPLCELDLELSDGVGLLAHSYLNGQSDSISYTFASAGTYFIRCFVRSGQDPGVNTDYLLNVTNNGPGIEMNFTADPTTGPLPLETSLDFSNSILPPGSSLYRVLWDYNGDGYIDFINDNNPASSVNVKYYQPGTFTAHVQVELDNGSGGQADVEVTVTGSSGEDEPNNDTSTAQAMPAFPFSQLYGDVGQGGNDGGPADYYEFPGNAGTTVNFMLTYQPGLAPMGLFLVDENEGVLASSFVGDGQENINFLLSVPGNYYIVIVTDPEWPASSGYELSGSTS